MANDFLKSVLDRLVATLNEIASKPVATADKSAPVAAPAEAPVARGNVEPRWLTAARAELGVKEIKGKQHNHVVLQYGIDAKVPDTSADEIPWCAWFVGAMLERNGITGTHKATAISYEKWGEAEPEGVYRPGAIIVFDFPGGASWNRHVGFVVGESKTHVLTRGGNQSNQVGDNWFSKQYVTAVRWPTGEPKSGPDKVTINPKDLTRVSDR